MIFLSSMHYDGQIGGVTKTADHFGVKLSVLVRNMRIKLYTGFLTVLQIGLTRVATVAANP